MQRKPTLGAAPVSVMFVVQFACSHGCRSVPAGDTPRQGHWMPRGGVDVVTRALLAGIYAFAPHAVNDAASIDD